MSGDFNQLFTELRSELGDDNFRNFLAALSGKSQKEKEVQYHPEKSLHKQLFDPEGWRRWIDPGLLACLSRWHEAGSPGDFSPVDLEAFPGIEVLSPGILSFPCFTGEFCQLLLDEVKHYQQSGMPERLPNTMNNYGLVLNDIGLRGLFSRILEQVLAPLGARLFGADDVRLELVKGQQTHCRNWGGSELDQHHTFVVQYAPDNDRNLDMHVDECEITFNIGLSEDDAYRGSQLAFCGMFYAEDHRKHSFTYQHRRGWCVVHCGKHRHGALDIDSGERASLIIWTKSRSFRRTQEYRELADMAHWKTGEADTICLSYTHDDDYADLVPPDFHFQMRAPSPESPESPGSPGSSPSREREPSLENLAWVRVCADNELEGRKLVQVGNREVAIFRHKGQLFALDDKCSHMGASLAGGDVEDLADDRCVVRCPGHGICFDLRTGESTKGAQQPTYPVRSTERGIEVAVPHTRGVKRAAEDSLEESAQKA